MKPIECIFSTILPENQHQNILNKYLDLENNVKLNDNILELDEKETKNYFTFSKDVYFQKCTIIFNELECGLEVNLIYNILDISYESTFTIKKYEFKFQDKIYFCFEARRLKKFLDDEYKKKKFNVKIGTEMTQKEFLLHFRFSNFEIVYNYNYKPVTLKELTKKNTYTNNEIIKASDLNYEFANYILLTEEDFNSFYYIDTKERKNFFRKLPNIFSKGPNFIALCGPFGCGKTVTLLKMINNPSKRAFYINLWTVFNLEIDELKKVLKYEYVKIIGHDFSTDNENDEIILYINKLKAPEDIYDFISKVIISLNKMDANIYYLIIDQYSSKYDDNNIKIKKIKKEVEGTKILMVICSSMNNYDVKENLAYSFASSPLAINKNKDRINYLYVGCLIKLDPLKEPLKNESIEFIKVLSQFGNLDFYYYRMKEALKDNKDFEYMIKEEEKIIKTELEKFYNNDQNELKIELAKIICLIKDKEIFLYNEIGNNLLKLPLKFLEIKTQSIPIYKLMKYISENNNFELGQRVHKYLENNLKLMRAQEDSMIYLMNSGICINEKEFSDKHKIGEKTDKINIFFLEGLFPYIVDIFSKIIYDNNLYITRSFFSNLSSQTQGGIIEFYLLEHIRYNRDFFGIKIAQFESIEVFVPNGFFYQNYSSRIKDTAYNYNEDDKIDLKADNINIEKEKIILPNKNILIKQRQFTGKYYDFAILIFSEENKGFYLILFQVSKNKISTQILFKEEHELALNRVKENLQKDFNVTIIGGYFCYIFTNYNKDNRARTFCENYKIPYLEFSFEDMKFNKNKPFILKDCFITKNFPFHNCFSILPDNKFKFKNLNENNYEEIIKYKNLFDFIPIEGEIKNQLNWIFKINNKSSPFNPNNDYAIFGFFDKMHDFNKKFSIWYNTKENKIYYYKDDNIESIKKELNFNDVNSQKKEWVLICSKYKYKYFTNKDMDKLIEKFASLIEKDEEKENPAEK